MEGEGKDPPTETVNGLAEIRGLLKPTTSPVKAMPDGKLAGVR